LSDRQEEEGRAPAQATAAPLTSPVTGEGSSPFQGFVVGIGASAGGLDALERLFQAMPADTGAAFVVVQHLSPDHKSMMDNLLGRHTAMPVRVAEQDVALAPDTVFLIPPGQVMRIAAGRLRLSPKPDHGLVLPIDIFFSSLAEQCADRALAVVLSGTGSDGSRGVVAVNAAGGFVFVQEPGSARFDGMPRSAIATGVADLVATAEELARQVAAQLGLPRPGGPWPEGAAGPAGVPAAPTLLAPMEAILDQLLASSGIDFRDYKPNTVARRIERRMQLLRTSSLAQYRTELEASPREQELLRRELLIPVTRFFRDTEAFEQLASEVVPGLLRQPGRGEPLRVWVAACSTGEEAYSVAMLLAEAFERLGVHRPVKIFATDVEPQHLEVAAAGQYPDTIAAEVSPTRLERFFVQRQGGWAVKNELRQMVIFARHNLMVDPPFTRMDLVTCRNALIYLQPAAQEQALHRLAYALRLGGHLMLGPSETLGSLHRDFVSLPGRYKLYRLQRHERPALMGGGGRHQPSRAGARRALAPVEATAPVGAAERLLRQAYWPPSLLINGAREVVHVFGNARELLQLGEGAPSLDVLKLLPRELAWAAGLLLQAVSGNGAATRAAPVKLVDSVSADAPTSPGAVPPENTRLMRLVARRLDAPAEEGLVLLSLEPMVADSGADTAVEMTRLDAAQQHRVELLERELEATHRSLQATIEELETANEELQATNEELMASNEELQSTNEELQSVNEELYTVNAEYQEKVDVLNGINADLENIAKATATPTLFVDEALRLTRFTPELARLFKVRESDRGRSIEDFAHLLHYHELHDDLRLTLRSGQGREREVQARDGSWWLARIQPYDTMAGGSSRAVMTFVDVTSVKDLERLQALLDSLTEHVAVLDAHGTITMVNRAWRGFAGANGDPALASTGPGCNYLQVCARAALADPGARAAHDGLLDVLEGRRTHFTLQYPCDGPAQPRWFVMHAAPLMHTAGGVVVSHFDISTWVLQADSPAAGAAQ
jgi:two-component system, chemotaxis family, CheB/CheR fusion protein